MKKTGSLRELSSSESRCPSVSNFTSRPLFSFLRNTQPSPSLLCQRNHQLFPGSLLQGAVTWAYTVLSLSCSVPRKWTLRTVLPVFPASGGRTEDLRQEGEAGLPFPPFSPHLTAGLVAAGPTVTPSLWLQLRFQQGLSPSLQAPGY